MNKAKRISLTAKKQGTYAIGYCRPPKFAQFRKGQTGNLLGRPIGTIALKNAIKRELQRDNCRMYKEVIHAVFKKALQGQFEYLELVWTAMEKLQEIQSEKTNLTKGDKTA